MRLGIVVLSLVLLVSCAQHEPGVPAPAGGSDPKAPSANRFLAYEHSIGIEAGSDDVSSLFEAAQATCLQAVEESCTILDAQLTRGDGAVASMRFRARSIGQPQSHCSASILGTSPGSIGQRYRRR